MHICKYFSHIYILILECLITYICLNVITFSNDNKRKSTVAHSLVAALSLPDVLLFGEDVWGADSEEKGVVFCSACDVAVGEVLSLLDAGASSDVIFNATIQVCISLNISNDIFCENMIEIAKVSKYIANTLLLCTVAYTL